MSRIRLNARHRPLLGGRHDRVSLYPLSRVFRHTMHKEPPARLIVGLVGLMLQASGRARADGLRRTPIDARRGPDDLRDR